MANKERQLKVNIDGDASGAKKAFQDTDTASNSTESSIDQFTGKIGKAFVGLAAGAKLVSEAVASVGREMENDRLGDKLAAQLNLTESESARVGESAGRLFAGAYGGSMEEVNGAIKSVSLNISNLGSLSTTELEGMTAKALDLASAFDKDVNEVTRAAGSLMKNGLAKDANEAFDLITAGFQVGIDKGDDFTDTIDEYSPLFSALGLSGKDAFDLLAQGIEAGARNSDFLADGIKEFQINAISGSKAAADGYRALGFNAEEMTKKIAGGGAGAKEGLDQVLESLRNTEDPVKRNAAAIGLFGTKAEDLAAGLLSLDPTPAVSALGDVAGAADQLGETLNDNLATKFEGFKRRMSQIPGEIGEAWMSYMSGDTAGAAVGIGKIFGLDEDSEEVAKIQEVLDFLRNILQEVIDFAREKFTEAKAFVDEIMPAIREVIDNVTNEIKKNWELWGEDLWNGIKDTWDNIKGVIDGVIRTIQGIIKTVLGVITGDWSMAWDGIKQAFGGIWDVIKNIVGGAIDIIKGALSGAWNTIKEVAGNAWEGIKNRISDAWEGIKSTASSGVDRVVEFAKSIPQRIKDGLGDLKDLLRDAGKRVIDGLIDGITDKIGALKDKLGGITDFIPKIKGPPEKDAVLLRPAGRLVLGGFIAGLDDKVPALQSELQAITDMVAVGGSSVPRSRASSARYGGSTGPIVQLHIGTLHLTTNDANSLVEQLQDMALLALPVNHENL